MWPRITRQTCHIFQNRWVAFVRHCRWTFCPLAKNSSTSRCSDFCKPRVSVAIRSIEVAMLARTAKYSAWRSRGSTCVEISWARIPSLSQHIALQMEECWQSYQPRQRFSSFYTSSRMLETLDITLHFTVPSRQFKTKSCWLRMHTVGTDPSWWWTCAP